MAVRALVTTEKFRLAISEEVAEQLQLDKITDHEVKEIGEQYVRFMPFMGPLCIDHYGMEAFTGALVCPTGVVIGDLLARELRMERQPVALDENTAPSARPVPSVSAPTRDAPGPASRILVVEDVISPEVCREICDYAASQPRQRAGVLDMKVDTRSPEKSFVDPKQRDTFLVPIFPPMFKLLRGLFYGIMTKHVEPFYGIEIAWWEIPQMLSYKKGGRYDPHIDADRWVDDGNGKGHWEPFLDRQISILLYLNSEFTGGKLNFPDHKIKIQPRPGLLVAFPSSSKYRHGAEPTESGERLALVSWTAIKGRQRIREERPANVIFMDEFEKREDAL